MRYVVVIIVVLFTLGLAACGGSPETTSGVPSATAGATLFNQKLMGTQPGCITCHSLEEGVTLIGPSLAGIGSRAGSTVEGQTVDEYLRDAIIKPDDHVVDGFVAGVMPEQIAKELSDDELNHIVAYLMTLK